MYRFGDRRLELPTSGVAVYLCDDCGLYFKSQLPTPEFLTSVMDTEAGKIWGDEYDFKPEISLLNHYVDLDRADLLDIGPGNGQLLRACGNSKARRSGLDMYMHPGLKRSIKGEFICGLLDAAELNWGGQPYDVVTLYDVLEHLYQPDVAFKNLNSLLKPGGIAIIETGNSDCHWAQKTGLPSWWYVSRFEHHVFWNESSISNYAKKNGFDIKDVRRVKSKAWNSKSFCFKSKQLLAYVIANLAPDRYARYAQKSGQLAIQCPAAPFMVDHLVMVLIKK